MKKHMLKETNQMRRLMGLSLLKEASDVPTDKEIAAVGSEAEKAEVSEFEKKEIGVYDNERQLRDYEDGKNSSMSMPTMDEEDDILQEGEESLPTMKEMKKCVSEGMSKKAVCEKYGGCNQEKLKEMYDKCKSMNEDDILQEQASMKEKNAYCQKEFGKDYEDCTDKQKEQCDENCGKAMNEDSEGEETYNYGEDEGADEHREDEMEDELHHDKEDMAPHDRIKAIEDHLDALKKDMGYDEDHEDRDEEGTHFAEGKRYSKVLNTLTESQYRRLKRFIK